MIYRSDDTNKNFITIEIENVEALAFENFNIVKAKFRCGQVVKTIENPSFPLEIGFNSEETSKFEDTNICYIAIYDEHGRKRTLEGSLTFTTKGQVV